ncbi:Fic family protein [Nisaea acidiphila]|uniref:Fic family protein n=1 Tax=Nisaea acidiphila TaxID=1862145 RepID=A0A9J7AZG2_9PROT|nr:Fic family protein [Nisaea acidiphila]UUX51809.1 Fic family protein [Nisaea acidiphila]
MTDFVWPDKTALLDDFAEYFEEVGQILQIRSIEDLEAGLDRARTAFDYTPDADAAAIAAIIFEGVTTRHALVDGNKRLGWQAMTTFLDMNGIWFDPPELDAYHIAMAVIRHEAALDDLAQFIRDHTSSVDPLSE